MRLSPVLLTAVVLCLPLTVGAQTDCSNPATAKAVTDQVFAWNDEVMQRAREKTEEMQAIIRRRSAAGELPPDFHRRSDTAMKSPKMQAITQEHADAGKALEAVLDPLFNGNAPPDFRKICEAAPKIRTLVTSLKAAQERSLNAMIELTKTIK